ncbi:unnamed protein product [Hydatigera taeniaeformis]|uniref:BTB/POZ domain-containing protein n=1 Tax=Hydatigena taeniaeformis TaxID=6205 RepID=A0A0R3X8V0_HYDTA|nr:unnamed protein product [Hydatigera taeniaeformis]
MTAMHKMFLRSSNRSTMGDFNHLFSPCFPTNFTTSWNHGGKNWTVFHGSEGLQSLSGNVFNACFEIAVKVITECELGANWTKDLGNLKQMEIQATSYMCSKTEEAGEFLINRPADGRVPVRWYFDAARRACSTPLSGRPFLCMELTYISALLSHGFDLPMDKYLNLNRTIGNIEVGWPVGFLVDILLRCF